MTADPIRTLSIALRWTARGLTDEAKLAMADLSDDQLRWARTLLMRAAVFTDEVRYTRPPDDPNTPRRACPYCALVDCGQRDLHAQWNAANETVIRRRAVAS